MADITEQNVADLALAPQISRNEEGMIQERPIDELVKADRLLNTKKTPQAAPYGIMVAKVRPGGTCS